MNPMENPCAACPWRISNSGKKTKSPDMEFGWYSRKNLDRLWNGLRTGEAPGMTCHPTDGDNPLPEGMEPPRETVEKRECAGALLLVQRELKLIEELGPEEYLKRSKVSRGLTKDGIAWWALSRCVFAGTPMGADPITKIQEDPDIERPMRKIHATSI